MCRLKSAATLVIAMALTMMSLSTAAMASSDKTALVELIQSDSESRWRLVSLFATGSISIGQVHQPALQRLAGKLITVAGVIRVEGHTDGMVLGQKTVRQFASNRALSRERARAVMGLLGDAEPSLVTRMTAVGLGSDVPLVSNDSPAGRATNRRIEIVVDRNNRVADTAADVPGHSLPQSIANWTELSRSTLVSGGDRLTAFRSTLIADSVRSSPDVSTAAKVAQVHAGVGLSGRLSQYSEQSMVDRYDPMESIVQWQHDQNVTVGQAIKAVASHAGYKLDMLNIPRATYDARLPVIHQTVEGVTVKAALKLLAGRGIATEFDHVTRTVYHRPIGADSSLRKEAENALSGTRTPRQSPAFLEPKKPDDET